MYARLRLSELTDRLRTAYEGFGRGDMDAILSVMDPDIEWDATDALAHTGVYQGPQNETGTIDNIGLQYSFSFGALSRYPEDWWGDGPDLVVMCAPY